MSETGNSCNDAMNPDLTTGISGNLNQPTTISSGDGNRIPKRARHEEDDDDEDKPRPDRRKIEIKFIQDKSRRHITFSKRKAGIMKKAYELSVLTGTQVLLLVVSETGLVYTFTTPKLQPLVTKAEGKNLIQACLNAPEPNSAPIDQVEEQQHTSEEVTDDGNHHQQIAGSVGHRNAVNMAPYHFPDHHQTAAYQQLLAAQQVQHSHHSVPQRSTYPMPPHGMSGQMPPHQPSS